jgi:hypothetical protein
MDEFSLTDDYDALREALRYKLDEQIMKNMKHQQTVFGSPIVTRPVVTPLKPNVSIQSSANTDDWRVSNHNLEKPSTGEKYPIKDLIENHKKFNDLYEFLMYTGCINKKEFDNFVKTRDKLDQN